MNIDYQSIGKRIKIARIHKDYSQESVANKVGISPKHMSNIETARTKPSLPTLISIANVLETTVDNFLCDNIVKSANVFAGEAKQLFQGCDDYELRIMVNILNATKEALKQEAEFRQRLNDE